MYEKLIVRICDSFKWAENALCLAVALVLMSPFYGLVAWTAVKYDLPAWSTVTVQDKTVHSITIRLYAKTEYEGTRQEAFVPTTRSDKPGHLLLNVRRAFGLEEAGRYDLTQAPSWSKEEKTRIGWPTGGNLIVTSRVKTDWTEERRDDNGIKRPKRFNRIEIVLDAKYGSFEPVTVFGSDYDQPDKLVKRDMIVLDYEAALALYEFVEAGTPAAIMIDVSQSR